MYCLICKRHIGEFGFTDKRSHEEGCPIYLDDKPLGIAITAVEEKDETRLRRAYHLGGAEVIDLNMPVHFELCEGWNSAGYEYYVRLGKAWLWMGLVAPDPDFLLNPNVHFVFAETSEEVGEHLLRLYPEYSEEYGRIEIKKAKVHRLGFQDET